MIARNLRGSHEHPGTGARIPGTTESIQFRSVGRNWCTSQGHLIGLRHARKLWFPYRGVGARWFRRGVVIPSPRLIQLLKLLRCLVLGHKFTQWRIETENWFEYCDGPLGPGSWTSCDRGCGTIAHILEPQNLVNQNRIRDSYGKRRG